MINVTKKYSLLVIALLAVAISAGATVLPPGSGIVAANPIGLPASYSIVAYTGVLPFSGVSATGAINGQYEEYVIKDLSTGYLDFLYAVQTGTLDEVGAVSVASFTGFTTDVGYDTCCGGTTIPTSVRRSSSGSTIDFFFNGIPNNTWSVFLQIDTNAYNFKVGSINIQNDANATVVGYAPASGVPEPGSLALLGSGLIGLGNVLRRKLLS